MLNRTEKEIVTMLHLGWRLKPSPLGEDYYVFHKPGQPPPELDPRVSQYRRRTETQRRGNRGIRGKTIRHLVEIGVLDEKFKVTPQAEVLWGTNQRAF